MRILGCGTQPARSYSAVGMGWDGVPQLQHPLSCRQFTGLTAGEQGWLDPSLKRGWRRRVATASPGPLLAPQQWSQTPFIMELHPKSPAPQMQERSRVSTLFLDAWVTQHPPRSLAWHMVPQSLQDISSLPGLAETEQCHRTGDVSVSTVPRVTLRTPRRGPQHPLLCHAAQGSPGSTVPLG